MNTTEEITRHFDYNRKSKVIHSQGRFILEYNSEFTSNSLELCGLGDSTKINGGVKTLYEIAFSEGHFVNSNIIISNF